MYPHESKILLPFNLKTKAGTLKFCDKLCSIEVCMDIVIVPQCFHMHIYTAFNFVTYNINTLL